MKKFFDEPVVEVAVISDITTDTIEGSSTQDKDEF